MNRNTRCIATSLALCVLGSAARAQSAPVGWTSTTNVTTDSGDANRRSSMAMRQTVIDGKLRMEFVQMSNMPTLASAEGMYQVLSAADSSMIIVMPSSRTATVMNIGGMLGGRDITPKFAPHLTKSQFEDLGAGEKILGHATHHVRVTSEGTIDVTMMGESCTAPVNSVSEMWIAPDVDLRASLASMAATLSGTMGVSLGEIPTEPGTTMPSGTPLRTINRVRRLNAQGQPITVTTTSEYVELSHGPLDPALFAAPSDFRVMDMRKLMAKMPQAVVDSAIAAGASKGAKSMCRAVGTP